MLVAREFVKKSFFLNFIFRNDKSVDNFFLFFTWMIGNENEERRRVALEWMVIFHVFFLCIL